MRIPSNFGERTLVNNNREPKKKYYLVYEGEKTEVQYFAELINQINQTTEEKIFDIIPLLRNYSNRNNSHPKSIIEHLLDYVKTKDTYQKLPDILKDYFIYEAKICDTGIYTENDIQKIIDSFCNNNIFNKVKASDKINIKIIKDDLENLELNNFDLKNHLDHIINHIKKQVTYEMFPEDEICLIIDFDHNSFKKPGIYDTIIEMCKSNNINLFVSNPNFEFWLLLHSDNVTNYSNDELLKNKKVNKSRRYLESILSKEFSGYKKNNIKAERFMPLIDKAIQKETLYCEDIYKMPNNLGTNVGILVQKLKS